MLWCVAGARESWDARPIEFEHRDEIDPGTDWTDLAIVIRNEPSPSHNGLVQVVARTRDGGEHIYEDQSPEPVRPGTLVSLYED